MMKSFGPLIFSLCFSFLTIVSVAQAQENEACLERYQQSGNFDVRLAGTLLGEALSDCDYESVEELSKFLRTELGLPSWNKPGFEDPLQCMIHSLVNENIQKYCEKLYTLAEIYQMISREDLPDYFSKNPDQAKTIFGSTIN